MPELVSGYDAVEVAAMPGGGGFYLAYIDGDYVTLPKVQAFVEVHAPGARILTVTTNGRNKADLCDVESGDANPGIFAQGFRDGLYDTAYSDLSNRGALTAAARGLPWNWFAADPTGVEHIPAGAVACQWAWGQLKQVPGNYDADVALASWLNPVPQPAPQPAPAPPPGGSDVAVSPLTGDFKPGQIDGFQVSDNTLWHHWWAGNPAVQRTEALETPEGVTGATGEPKWSIIGGALYVTTEDSNGKQWGAVQASNANAWAYFVVQ